MTFKPTSFSEKLMFTTARIETRLEDGRIGHGTGFFFDYFLDDTYKMPLFITNKHVVTDDEAGKRIDTAVVVVHLAEGTGDEQTPSRHSAMLGIEGFGDRFYFHPSDEVDLCAMPMTPLIDEATRQGHSLYTQRLDSSVIPSDETLQGLNAVEDIRMIGYPNGLWDDVNNLPLTRRGITATHPAIDFRSGPHTVIDMACFPGSSGSPVVIADEGMYYTKDGTTTMASRFIFLGILYAGPVITQTGTIEIHEIPTVQVPISVTNAMMHLGYIVKAKEILTLVAQIPKTFPGLA